MNSKEDKNLSIRIFSVILGYFGGSFVYAGLIFNFWWLYFPGMLLVITGLYLTIFNY